jgi:hypothetical protein
MDQVCGDSLPSLHHKPQYVCYKCIIVRFNLKLDEHFLMFWQIGLYSSCSYGSATNEWRFTFGHPSSGFKKHSV